MKKIFQNIMCIVLSLILLFSVNTVFVLAESASAETTFDFDDYDYSDPSDRIENFPTDEDFFGVWDEKSQEYTTNGMFNYDYVSPYGYDMSSIEEYVKAGNYEKAKEALLEYYRGVNDKRCMKRLEIDNKDIIASKLMLYNMHDIMGESFIPSDIFSVGNDWKTINISVLESVNYIIGLGGAKYMPIGLYALTKNDYEAVFKSKESDVKPYLELVVNGMTVKLEPKYDAYVAGGEYRNNNYGKEKYLYARESARGEKNPVDSNTRRSFLMFDLSKYDMGDTISSAVLKIEGKWVDKADGERSDYNYEQKLVAISDVNVNWTEDDLTYMSNGTPIFSYEGQIGTPWIQPRGDANPDQIFEEHLFRFAWLDSLTPTYVDTKDEQYARYFFSTLHHFIENTYNVYRGMDGWTWIRNKETGEYVTEIPPGEEDKYTVECSWTWTQEDQMKLLYGGYGKSLDLSVRAANIAKYMPYYYNSEYLTPELFGVFVKYIYSMGKVLSQYYGRSENAGNWGNYSNKGFYSIIAYYPEFAATDEWKEILFSRVGDKASSILLKDGSTEEGSTSYTISNLSNLFANKTIADDLGIKLEYSDEVREMLEKLTVYCTNLLLPWGGDPGFGDCVPHTGDYYSGLMDIADWLDSEELQYIYSYGKKGRRPDWKSKYYDFRQMLMMRSDWRKDALYLYTNTTGSPYSHNHWDTLEVIAAAYGEYLLIDPGYYNLTEGDLFARWLISSRGHNTVEINDYCHKRLIAPSIDVNYREALPKGGTTGTMEKIEFNDAYNFARVKTDNAKNITYFSDPKLSVGGEAPPTEPGMDFHRDILMVNSKFWIVSDYMNPVDDDVENKYTQLWHTLPDMGISIDGQYKLKQGEAVGDLTKGELDTQIENTQYVKGTGTGALMTTKNNNANIMVVPSDINSVEPKIMRGLYSPMKGSVVRAGYGLFEKHARGTTGFDTVLYPTRAGEKYTVTTTPLQLSLPKGAGSAFKANIKNVSGNNNDDYDFSYYVLHEEDKKKDVQFGDYKTDGMLAYYEKETDGRARGAILKDGTYISDEDNDYKIVYSKSEAEDVSVRWENNEIKIDSSKELALNDFTIYSSTMPYNVYLNGEKINFKYASNYVYFGEKPILNGSNIVPIMPPDNDSSYEKKDETSGHGIGGGGGGFTGRTKPYENDNDKKEDKENKFFLELNNHWGTDEITYLLNNKIINGDGNSLNLKADVTRAEFIAMVVRAMKLEEKDYVENFSDVDKGAWYASVIQTAYDEGLIIGTQNGIEPNEPITREQAVKIMMSAVKGVQTEKENKKFTDEDSISFWAKEYIDKAVSLGVINGMGDGSFNPKAHTLREQAMVMIYRLIKLNGGNIK